MKTIAFFNNKGGVGKTTLVYHLAWMYADLGFSVVAADLDPQANLSAVFLDDERLERLWPDDGHPDSILGAMSPILRGLGDIREPHLEPIADNLGLVAGDLGLSGFEAKLSSAWPACMEGDESAFRIESAFHRTILDAADQQSADFGVDRRGSESGRHQPGRDHRGQLRRIPARPRSVLPAGAPQRRSDARRVAPRMAGSPGTPSGGSRSRVAVGRYRAGRHIVMQHAVRAGLLRVAKN